MTTMDFIFCQMLKKQTENADIFWPNSGHNLRGVGGEAKMDSGHTFLRLFFWTLPLHTLYMLRLEW